MSGTFVILNQLGHRQIWCLGIGVAEPVWLPVGSIVTRQSAS